MFEVSKTILDSCSTYPQLKLLEILTNAHIF